MRYYTVCEMTPARDFNTYRNTYFRIYPNSPSGFLFHDTEEALTFPSIQRALFVLSELYDIESAKTMPVVAARVDANTIVATFNTQAFPRPKKIERHGTEPYEFLSTTQLEGWVHEDIRKPSVDAKYLRFDQAYEHCTMLERFTGHCPCPKLNEGTCLTGTVFTEFPWLELRSYNDPDGAMFKRQRYKEVDDFKYISAQYTTKEDFTDARRPWNHHDFKLVEERTHEFSLRGKANARRHHVRKEICSKCAFSCATNTGGYKDCGQVDDCSEASDDKDVLQLLHRWFDQTPFVVGSDGFTVKQIEYLVRMSGTVFEARTFSEARAVGSKYAGFRMRPFVPFHYAIAPTKGDLTRVIKCFNYDDLRRYLPLLPDEKDMPEWEVPTRMLMAHAIFSTIKRVKLSSGYGDIHSIEHWHSNDVTMYGAIGRSKAVVYNLSLTSPVTDFYNYLSPNQAHRIKTHLRTGELPQLRSGY